jgi:hypothetical protein
MDGTPLVRLRFNTLIERPACDLLAGDEFTLHRIITVLRSSPPVANVCRLHFVLLGSPQLMHIKATRPRELARLAAICAAAKDIDVDIDHVEIAAT